ncbi:MAG: Hsp20/alpha crystallin family protein [Caldilineae bacterium]|nr:MAG: Hsp20/alpha crystallin family protein [Caldilineae bacterium]
MMYLARRNPIREAMALHNALDRLFDEALFRPFSGYDTNGVRTLALDMYETDDNLIVEAALPGITPEDVEIAVQDGVLTIKGEIKREAEENVTYHLRERYPYTAFERAITLPVDINADAAEATFKNGILTLVLPKAEEVKPKRIEVKAK